MNIIPSDDDNEYVKQLVKQNPKLKKEIISLLTQMLLQGEIGKDTYQNIVGEHIKPFSQTVIERIKEKPELKGQLAKMVEEYYLKGNIEKTDYEKMKAMTYEKQTATHGKRIAFNTPINYKTKSRTINIK